MTNIEEIKKAVIDICKENKGKEIIQAVNNKRDYKEISKEAKTHPTNSSRVLNKAATFGLIKKEGNVWKKNPEFKYVNINRTLREENIITSKTEHIKYKKKKKITDTSQIKKSIREYILNQFKEVPHPFGGTCKRITDVDLINATDKLFNYLEQDGPERLTGLKGRFYESFSSFISSDRIRKEEYINNFSSLVRNFEPYVKKVVAIKTKDASKSNPSLSKEMISQIISFNSDLNNVNEEYWKNKPIHEASIRSVYPFRHIESHEARDYPIFEMEKIVYYLFASLIFINLDF